MAIGTAIAGLVVAAAGTAASVTMQNKAQKQQKKANAEQRNLERMQRQAEARERYRQLRRERASMISNVEQLGASYSSSAQTGVSSVQTAGNIAQGLRKLYGWELSSPREGNIRRTHRQYTAQWQ